jgi:hypothetical protein
MNPFLLPGSAFRLQRQPRGRLFRNDLRGGAWMTRAGGPAHSFFSKRSAQHQQTFRFIVFDGVQRGS